MAAGEEEGLAAEPEQEPAAEEPRSFKDLGVTDVLCEACDQLGWKVPTKIQIEAIPVALQEYCSARTLEFFGKDGGQFLHWAAVQQCCPRVCGHGGGQGRAPGPGWRHPSPGRRMGSSHPMPGPRKQLRAAHAIRSPSDRGWKRRDPSASPPTGMALKSLGCLGRDDMTTAGLDRL